ncbi:MAG: GIY-YIG nuclease family protein [Candidatus Pacebacteria bacterium]|nr:GIY-YIG nuclease family protein [Candidatus Paceibacterota bacterium]
MYYVYILRCSDDSLYTGITTDLKRRVKEHNGEIVGKGARYTHARRPVYMVYQQSFKNRSSASQEESRIKKMTKIQKEEFIKTNQK